MNPVIRFLSILCVVLFGAASLFAVGTFETGHSTSSGIEDTGNYPMTFFDDTGVEVSLNSKPQRIVSVTVFTDDILLDLVDASRLIAVTAFAEDKNISNVSDRVSDIPNKITLNVEVILSLQPDIVYVANWSESDKVQQLRDAGIQVYLLESGLTVSRIQEQILAVAAMVGETEKGEQLVAGMNSRLKAVSDIVSKIADEDRPSVLDYAMWGTVPGEGTSWAEILSLAGVKNTVEGFAVNEWGQVPVSKELLVELNPDILILPGWVYGDPAGAENNFKQVKNDPALKGMEAVKQGKVYMMPEQIKTSTSQYIVSAVEYLAKTAYPDLF